MTVLCSSPASPEADPRLGAKGLKGDRGLTGPQGLRGDPGNLGKFHLCHGVCYVPG